jgi:hypothetical protein
VARAHGSEWIEHRRSKLGAAGSSTAGRANFRETIRPRFGLSDARLLAPESYPVREFKLKCPRLVTISSRASLPGTRTATSELFAVAKTEFERGTDSAQGQREARSGARRRCGA